MPLRLNNNQSSLNLQNILLNNSRQLKGTLSKLASGYRINTAADGPAALVISEQLRAQLTGLAQAQENTQDAMNMVNTAEGAMNEMNTLLRDMRQLGIAAANTGTMDDAQINALQAQINSSVRSIDRIASTTKFAEKRLLNGSQTVQTANVDAAIQDINVTGAQTSGTFQIEVTAAAEQAAVGSSLTAAQFDTTVRLTGNLGTETLTFAAGTSVSDIENAINAVSENTGVVAQGGKIMSAEFGSNQFVELEYVEGYMGLTVQQGRFSGTDVQASINGNQVSAEGNNINVNTGTLNAEINLQAGTGAGTYNFDITGGGMTFQLGDYVAQNEQVNVGIASLNSSNLGAVGGQNGLASLLTGGINSLSENPEEAVRIIDRAINQVSTQRARLGAFAKDTLEPNLNSLSVAFENITATESRIRDTNMALEMTKFVQERLKNQSTLGLLSQANMLSENVLQLLS